MTTNSTQGLYRSFAAIRILFGLVWLINTYLQLNPAYIHLFAHSLQADLVAGQPAWLQAYGAWTLHWVTIVGPVLVAKVTIVLDALLAVSLITGLGLPFLAWLGFFYNLWLWSTVGGLGGPYTTGATDPGTAIIYALCFLLVIWSRSWQVWSLQPSPVRLPQAAGMETGRIVFGLPGMTANKGDVLGTTNIYVIAFLFVGAWVYLRPRPLQISPEIVQDSSAS